MTATRVILIAGPTASGKSAIALALAERLGGMIINADSMQVYNELAILTARPTSADVARAPHRLYGVVPASEAYSVGRWVKDAAAAISEARTAGLFPIIAGGTGLYFKALLEGLSPIPDIPDDVRRHWRQAAETTSAPALWDALRARDPETAAALRPTDKQRLVRALEVITATGRPLVVWQRIPGRPVINERRTLKLLIVRDRAQLQERADLRLDAMIAHGALEEVRRLAALNLSAELPCMRALGVHPLLAHLSGKMSLADAVARTKQDTRAYIKRQETWARRNMMSWNKIIS
jgi:tRNA dimethylallyltransferase